MPLPLRRDHRARAQAVDDDAWAHEEHQRSGHEQRPAQGAQGVEELVGGALEVLAPRDRVERQHERAYAGVALQLEAHWGVGGQHALMRLVATDREHLGVLLQFGHLFHTRRFHCLSHTRSK